MLTEHISSIYICGRTSSYMRMLNSSLLGNEKLHGQVVHNVGGVRANTKNVLKWNRALWLLLNIRSSDYGNYHGENKPILLFRPPEQQYKH